MKKQFANPLVLQFILPLVEMLQTASSDEKQLTDKTIGILRSRLGKPKETAIPDDTASIVVLLRSLHQRARKAHSPEVIAVISICSLFVSKCIISKDEQAVSRIYKESISDFVTRKASSLNRAFFIDFVKRFPSRAWDIRASIPEVAPNAANGFRQAQLFSIIQSLFTAIPTPVRIHNAVHIHKLISPRRNRKRTKSLPLCPPLQDPWFKLSLRIVQLTSLS